MDAVSSDSGPTRLQTLRRILKNVPWLRSAYYLMLELPHVIADGAARNHAVVANDFGSIDPWSYDSSSVERARLEHLQAVIAPVVTRSSSVLEIGCAEGAFTTRLAAMAGCVVAADISVVAMQRATERCRAHDNVSFLTWNLRCDPPPGIFDVVVISGVLEYFASPRSIRQARETIVGCVRPGGYLAVLTTRANPVVEESWWGRLLLRGRWINAFVSRHPDLRVVAQPALDWYALTLLQHSPHL